MKLHVIFTICMCTSLLMTCNGDECVCSYHNEIQVFKCPDKNDAPFTSLYHDGLDDNCLIAVPNMPTPAGWKAGIYVDDFSGKYHFVFIQADSDVRTEQCPLSRNFAKQIDYDTKCSIPIPGSYLTPTTAKQTTHTTASTPSTTPKPTTPTTASTPPTTPTTTTSTTASTLHTSTFIPVPTVAVPNSQKCDFGSIVQNFIFKNVSSHQDSRPCQGTGLRAHSEALLLKNCNYTQSHYIRWQSDIQVSLDCTHIPMGEPLGLFHPGGQLPLGGFFFAFWKCKPSSFEVVYQECGFPEIIDIKVSTQFQHLADQVYTLKL